MFSYDSPKAARGKMRFAPISPSTDPSSVRRAVASYSEVRISGDGRLGRCGAMVDLTAAFEVVGHVTWPIDAWGGPRSARGRAYIG